MSNKPRKKKKRSVSRTINNIAKSQIRKFWCASGHCVDDMQFGGIRYKEVAVANMLVDDLLGKPQYWQVWYGVFCTDGDKSWCDWDIVDMGGKTTTDKVANLTEPLIEKMAKRQNSKHLVSPGWFAVPCGEVDLHAMADDIIERFRQWGAFNIEHCKMTWGLREMNRMEKNA